MLAGGEFRSYFPLRWEFNFWTEEMCGCGEASSQELQDRLWVCLVAVGNSLSLKADERTSIYTSNPLFGGWSETIWKVASTCKLSMNILYDIITLFAFFKYIAVCNAGPRLGPNETSFIDEDNQFINFVFFSSVYKTKWKMRTVNQTF